MRARILILFGNPSTTMRSASVHVKWMYRSEIELKVYGTSNCFMICKIHYVHSAISEAWSTIYYLFMHAIDSDRFR